MKQLICLTTLFLLLSACQSYRQDQNHDLEEWPLTGFIKADSINPILEPDKGQGFFCPLNQRQVFWEARNVLNPSAIVKEDQVYLFYRAQDSTGTSRIGLATSKDGLHFQKEANPVFYPAEDSLKVYEWNFKKSLPNPPTETCSTCYFDGVEDPRIIQGEDGTYIMTYTAYDGKTARLAIASSQDLRNWAKHGLVLDQKKYRDTWSKSGAIIGTLKEGQIIAKKIQGYYWMYFGDTNLFMARSTNLIDWEILEDQEKGSKIQVLHPRPGYFDSRLVEPGPFGLLTDSGILLLYNASNAANWNDPDLPIYTYAAGQALFDAEKPYLLLDRMDTHFIHPDKDYEKLGEVNEVCFVEGMVYFQEKWFLYYGTADSRIAVAVRE